MNIPLSSPDITDAEIEAVTAVLRSGRLSLGAKLEEFENDFCRYINCKHAVGVSSGTSGLHLCLRALGLGPGDEVITTPFSFIASANAMLFADAVPVFVDIDPLSRNIDPTKIEAAITPKTRAILVVHVFGRPASMTEIMHIAKQHGLFIIEDACEALGAEYRDYKVGGLGDVAVFGFYPNKQITTGEGGMITTNNEALARSVKRMRNQGRDPGQDWHEHVELGYNYRLSEIACALGVVQLRRIQEILSAREAVARKYSERLASSSKILTPSSHVPDGRQSWFVYVVQLVERYSRFDRDRVVQELTNAGIGCGRYFAPIHLQPFYRKRFGFEPGMFPNTEALGDRAIALPFFNKLGDSELDFVCERFTHIVERL